MWNIFDLIVSYCPSKIIIKIKNNNNMLSKAMTVMTNRNLYVFKSEVDQTKTNF